ncbi:MAG TPA: glycosyltransferase [Candidatus Dormibacteraeota bacterium]|nr:glycosyltransferase [Candidatus Dormibacteraeota bacterium]
MIDGIVVGLHLRWRGVHQRPHHLLSRLARRFPVVVLEEPLFASAASRFDVEEAAPGVTVIRPVVDAEGPYLASRIAPGALDLLAESLERLGVDRPAVWLYTPMMTELADAFPAAPLIYDCMDDLASFAFAPPEMRARERELLERADVVFCGGRSLYRARIAYGPKVHCVPSGVEFTRFAAARTVEPVVALSLLARPVLGYVGVIDERIDYEIVARIARGENASVVLVGPIAKIDPRTLPSAANLHYAGQVDYPELPRWIAGFDVALMPFALNESTRSISPTKLLEYFAAGRPVVTTPVPDVVERFGDLVSVAEGPEAFAAACLRARPEPHRDGAARAAARAQSWDAVAASMERALAAGATLWRDAPGPRREPATRGA